MGSDKRQLSDKIMSPYKEVISNKDKHKRRTYSLFADTTKHSCSSKQNKEPGIQTHEGDSAWRWYKHINI